MARRIRPSRAARPAYPKPDKFIVQDDRIPFLQRLFSAVCPDDNAADRRLQAAMELSGLTMELA